MFILYLGIEGHFYFKFNNIFSNTRAHTHRHTPKKEEVVSGNFYKHIMFHVRETESLACLGELLKTLNFYPRMWFWHTTKE